MKLGPKGRFTLQAELEQWPLVAPFRITGYTWEVIEVLHVTLESDGHVGHGEAAGVYYKQDNPVLMIEQLERLRESIEAGISINWVQQQLPPGGARNALDCATWDLAAKLTGRPVWQLAGLPQPRPLLTTFTCSADTPELMAVAARAHRDARALKLKLTGDESDADRVRAVRESRPDVWLSVDANQGFDRVSFERLLPALVDARIDLIEQPFPVGEDALLDGLQCPIPLAADESVQSQDDIQGLQGRFDVINIKLDKCGGFTGGLEMARKARHLGFDAMVGNMLGTSLAMAPAYLLGQICKIVDLDGPVFHKADRQFSVQYLDGYITCPASLWG